MDKEFVDAICVVMYSDKNNDIFYKHGWRIGDFTFVPTKSKVVLVVQDGSFIGFIACRDDFRNLLLSHDDSKARALYIKDFRS